jgi:hypothetical protein
MHGVLVNASETSGVAIFDGTGSCHPPGVVAVVVAMVMVMVVVASAGQRKP